MKTITGHYEWSADESRWLPVDERRDADNQVLRELSPDRLGISEWLPIGRLLSMLPEAYRNRIAGNGSNMFNRGRGLGKDFIFAKEGKGRIDSVRSIGLVRQIERYAVIRPDILRTVGARRCVILDTRASIEVDHKAGRKDERRLEDLQAQDEEDFQPLHATANDVKRSHCRRCLQSHQRYDARRLGYSHGWWVGDAKSDTCNGCYWHDPRRFNEEMSRDFEPR